MILLHMVIATPLLTLHHTNWVSENDNALQHDCLRVVVHEAELDYKWQIIFYCMNEFSPKFKIVDTNLFPNFAFIELAKRNISSEQLYIWSAPIDIIERYQFFLNQLSTSNDISLGKEIFYNCTIPRFGPMCQYDLYYYRSDHLSLRQLISDFYHISRYHPTDLTCYTHLNCNRGTSTSCLDWSEICNGQIDCLNDGLDEKYCWQLEINKCKDDEYRCSNGQCIPQSFYHDDIVIPDCLDGSDETRSLGPSRDVCQIYHGASIGCEDVICQHTPLTSSCLQKRSYLLIEAMYLSENISTSDHCRSAFKCLLNFLDSTYTSCNKICEGNACKEIVQNTCPDFVYFPNAPILYGSVYFAYTKNYSQWTADFPVGAHYICYNRSHFSDLSVNTSNILFDNMACIPSEQLLSRSKRSFVTAKSLDFNTLFELYNIFKKSHLIFDYTPAICNRSNMYQCIRSSKCISVHRLMDSIDDCPYMDDQNMTIINSTDLIERLKKTHFICQSSNKFISRSFIENRYCDCGYIEDDWCEDEDLNIDYIRRNISFHMICDGITHLLPIVIDGRNETDETECDQWQCDNVYTRCDRMWNCPDGADEGGCHTNSVLNCSAKHHSCVSRQTNQFMCLPIEKANDGYIDCLGGTDEQALCRRQISHIDAYTFLCVTGNGWSCIAKDYLCDGFKHCKYGDDEQFCTNTGMAYPEESVCFRGTYATRSEVERFLCDNRLFYTNKNIIYFTLDRTIDVVEVRTKQIENSNVLSLSKNQIFVKHQSRCHRGLDLRVWLNNQSNLTESTCLCPPSYYGDLCQYQNERISVSTRCRALSNSWRTLFAIVISLIDDSEQRMIHSYEQFTYLSISDCRVKFHFYLLYSNRRRDSTKNYSIHIDIYEKVSLAYRGSLLFPIHFLFLPVHRLAFIIDIPRSNDTVLDSCLNDPCIHGKCIKYSNNIEDRSFCQCNPGWSGQNCTIQHICSCASDSLCIGLSSNNRSICVCPLNKFGPRCLLINSICQNENKSKCENGGHCIPIDDYIIPNENFLCTCPDGFTGKRCEIADSQLILSFSKSIILSQSLFIHFIDVTSDDVRRSTTFRTFPVLEDSLVIHWSQSFHLVFIELFSKNYYLAIFQKTYNQSARIPKMINPSDRCPSINELFNETFVQLHLLRRIKYYHLPCQNESLNLSCFYDDVHLCLCYDFRQQRLANCFNFNHNMTFDCLGQSGCENGGQCFQDTPDCPKRAICICPECFYGRRCQFNTDKFSLSLDAILGYHISSYHSIIDQSLIVQFSLALTLIFIVIGLIDSVLSISTFKNKVVREIGCGLYLLCLSVTSLLTTIMFGLKFWILIFAQTTIISNRSFLSVQCHLIDFLLGICLTMNQWLHSCVTVDRAITVIKGAGFVKETSKQTAKFVIITLTIVITSTSIYDPIYRRLIDEETDNNDDQKRTWCAAIYPTGLYMFHSILHAFYFFVPFTLNIIAALILITRKARQQATINTKKTYKEILRTQFHQHKHLLTDPIVSVILALPRLIITYVSQCMTSPTHAWLYLIGYFFSFVPPMLTFLTFILPSKFYKEEFRKSIQQYRVFIRRRFYVVS